MNFLMEFVNLFVVPFVGLFLYRNKTRPRSRFFLLGVYSILCALNVIAVKLVSLFASRIFKISLELDSARFTAAALLCTIFISVLCVVFTEFITIQIFMEKKDEDGKK